MQLVRESFLEVEMLKLGLEINAKVKRKKDRTREQNVNPFEMINPEKNVC